MSQEKLDKKIVAKAAKTSLSTDAKTVKLLKKRIKALENKMQKCAESETNEIEQLIRQAEEQITEIADRTALLTTLLIWHYPSSPKSEKIVKKMGYQTVEVYLADNPEPDKQTLRDCLYRYTEGWEELPTGKVDKIMLLDRQMSEMFMEKNSKISEEAKNAIKK